MIRLWWRTPTTSEPIIKDPVAVAPVPVDSERWVPAESNDITSGYREGWDPLSPSIVGAPLEMYHLDGVPWWEAPLPSKRHQCVRQTYAWSGYFNSIERCACGAIRRDGRFGVWDQRNERTD